MRFTFWRQGSGVHKPFGHVSQACWDARDADVEQPFFRGASDSQNRAIPSGLILGGGASSIRIARKRLKENAVTVYVPLCRNTQLFHPAIVSFAFPLVGDERFEHDSGPPSPTSSIQTELPNSASKPWLRTANLAFCASWATGAHFMSAESPFPSILAGP